MSGLSVCNVRSERVVNDVWRLQLEGDVTVGSTLPTLLVTSPLISVAARPRSSTPPPPLPPPGLLPAPL